MRHRAPRALCVLVCLSPLLAAAPPTYADDAEVVPRGVMRVGATGKFYFTIDKRFDQDGKVEDIAAPYNASLNSSVFPGLSLLESVFGLPPGSASLGNSVVSLEYNATQFELLLAYGLTDRLSVGVQIPYWWLKSRVGARLDTSTATVGKSPALGSLVPLGLTSDTVPLTTEDVQQILGRGLDINGDGTIDVAGFGFKRFQTWSGNGFADIEAGFKYQYLRTQDWRLAFTGGARFPTGEVDDPDDLADLSFGDGTYALLFRFQNDYTGIENLVLNGTFRYDLLLPDHETRRVPDNVDQPITANKEKVSRDLGDVFEFELSGKYTFYKGLSFTGLYKFGFKLKDQVSGKRGFDYSSLEEETDYTEHVGIVGLSYTTIPLYLEKRFPIPVTASLSYRNRFAGTNNVLKSEYIAFSLDFFF